MKKNNLLDYKPSLNTNTVIKFNSEQKAIIEIYHKGFYAFICSKFLNKPNKTKIKLDEIGSYLFLLIDGNTTVYEIAQNLKQKFNENTEPLYPRLIKYLQLLVSKKAIILKK